MATDIYARNMAQAAMDAAKASPSGSSGGVWEDVALNVIDTTQSGNNCVHTCNIVDYDKNQLICKAIRFDVECFSNTSTTTVDFSFKLETQSSYSLQVEIPANGGATIVLILDGWGGYTRQVEIWDSNWETISKAVEVTAVPLGYHHIGTIVARFDNSADQTVSFSTGCAVKA